MRLSKDITWAEKEKEEELSIMIETKKKKLKHKVFLWAKKHKFPKKSNIRVTKDIAAEIKK